MEESVVNNDLSTSSSSNNTTIAPSFWTALLAGGVAGTCVDIALYPIDTIKTRIQSPIGFWKAGGFRGIYNGLGAAAIGSAPGAALFFGTYETLKPIIAAKQQQQWFNSLDDETDHYSESTQSVSCHMIAASLGEAAACLVRVPTEVIKAKMQTAHVRIPLWDTIRTVLAERHGGSPLSGITGGLYRGYGITLFREIPFAMIQFPLYEKFKVTWAESQNRSSVTPIQAAACGSLSGGIAAAFTTPLDVLKTRHMLGYDRNGVAYKSLYHVLRSTIETDGYSALWKGIQPRVMWITIGGFVFFGAYEESKTLISPLFG